MKSSISRTISTESSLFTEPKSIIWIRVNKGVNLNRVRKKINKKDIKKVSIEKSCFWLKSKKRDTHGVKYTSSYWKINISMWSQRMYQVGYKRHSRYL